MNKEEQSKLIKQLMKDMKLLTDTAKIMHQKMESVQSTTIQLLNSLGVDGSELPTEMVTQAATREATAATSAARKTPDDFKQKMTTESITELLSAFSSYLQKASNPNEVSDRLDRLRDKLIPLYSGGFHPAFAEMGRIARDIKGIKELDAEAKKMLQEKIIDWRSRLAK
ncbi:MAG: hypothetical protein ACFFD4_11840 [Candidatus Odinarchaeota archaeon]